MNPNVPSLHIPHQDHNLHIPHQHHSWADWDFDNALMYLNEDFYLSPPSSVSRTSLAAPSLTTALCKAGSVYNLTVGQMEGHIWKGAAYPIALLFRNQAPAGTSAWLQTYIVFFGDDMTYCWRHDNGEEYILLPIFDYIMPLEEWVLFRLSWWQGINLQCGIAVSARLEIYEAGEWADKGISRDIENRYSDTGIARPGFMFNRGPHYLDDLIIRGPV